MLNSRLIGVALLIITGIFIVSVTSCFGNSTAGDSGSSAPVAPQPQVESVLATTSGTHLGYYTILDIKVKNNGAEGIILVQASVTQNGNTNHNEMPVYLSQGEEQELKLTFPLVWKGGDFTCNVQAVLPSSTTGAYYVSPPTTSPNTLFSSQTISQGPNTQTVVYTFSPTYSGYIFINGTSSSSTGYILVINTNSGASNTYNFGTSTTINAQLNSGNTYAIYFGNRDTSGNITATLTGTYSSTSSTSGLNSLFTSQTIYVSPGMQTIVYTFNPTYTGSVRISGTSNSSTGYIVITNNSSGASNTYAFGTGTTISAQLNAGNSYGIYFGNHDASGTITATLTGTYQP